MSAANSSLIDIKTIADLLNRLGGIPADRVRFHPYPGSSNTPREMQRKIADYFHSGVELVWIFDPRERTVAVYTGPARSFVLDENGILDGGDVLPGFMLPIKPLFDEMDEQMGLSST